jgi:type I restriction enzyme, S subunit
VSGNAKVPKLRFSEFRDAGEWETKKLKNVCEINPINSGLPDKFIYIDLESVDAGVLTSRKMIEKTEAPSRAQRLLQSNDVIFQIVRPYQRNNLYFKATEEMAYVASTGYAQLRAIDSPEFLFQSVHVDDFVDGVIAKCTGSNYPAINSSDLAEISLAVPKPDEQEKIADCLTSLDEVITLEAQKLATLKTHKKGLMQQLFPAEGETLPKLRFPEFRDAGEWEEKQIGEVFKVTRGDVLSMTLVKDKKTSDAGYPVYSSQTKNNGLSGYYSDFLYEDAITWTTDGANAGDVNYRSGKFYCTNVCGVLINTEGYANPFIAALINSVSRNHVSYVGNPKLMNGVMAKIAIPFPTVEEQQRIADCLASLDELIAAQTQKLAALKTHKKGLMQQLFPVLDEGTA